MKFSNNQQIWHCISTKPAIYFVLLAFVFLGACESLPFATSLDSQVARQVARGDFEQAILLIEQSSLDKSTQDNYIAKIREQQKQTTDDIQKARKEIEKLIDDDHWQEAQLHLAQLRQRYPHNLQLKQYQNDLNQRQQTRRLILEAELLVTQLEQLQKNKQHYLQQGRVDNKKPESFYYDKLLQQYSQRLATIALELSQRDELIRAKQFSLIALQANDTEFTQKKHALVLQEIEQRSGELLTRLEQQYKRAIDQGELEKARDIMQQMLFLAPDNKQYLAQQHKLEQHIQQEVERLLEDGRKFYAKGDIDQAIALWEQGLRLEPGHKELKRLLSHAYKGRATLDRIRRQQAQ